MNQKELKGKLDKLAESIMAEVPKAKPGEAKFAEALLVGIAVFGELLIDIKRIADAVEQEVALTERYAISLEQEDLENRESKSPA
jgi:hypothetical protein